MEGDGLLIAEANRGMQVAPTDISQVEQYYAMRLLVEPPTIAAVVAEFDEAELAKMTAELDSMEADQRRIRSFQEAHMRFHEYGIKHYPPVLAELIHSLHLKIYRHQRLYFSRPQVPADFTSVDRMFLEAIRTSDTELARQLLEFHLLDAAIGLVGEGNPDHRYDALLVAVRGLGIVLDVAADATLPHPAHIEWRRSGAHTMPSITTANLVHTAEERTERRLEVARHR